MGPEAERYKQVPSFVRKATNHVYTAPPELLDEALKIGDMHGCTLRGQLAMGMMAQASGIEKIFPGASHNLQQDDEESQQVLLAFYANLSEGRSRLVPDDSTGGAASSSSTLPMELTEVGESVQRIRVEDL